MKAPIHTAEYGLDATLSIALVSHVSEQFPSQQKFVGHVKKWELQKYGQVDSVQVLRASRRNMMRKASVSLWSILVMEVCLLNGLA